MKLIIGVSKFINNNYKKREVFEIVTSIIIYCADLQIIELNLQPML